MIERRRIENAVERAEMTAEYLEFDWDPRHDFNQADPDDLMECNCADPGCPCLGRKAGRDL